MAGGRWRREEPCSGGRGIFGAAVGVIWGGVGDVGVGGARSTG